jgi:hypothetical protein
MLSAIPYHCFLLWQCLLAVPQRKLPSKHLSMLLSFQVWSKKRLLLAVEEKDHETSLYREWWPASSGDPDLRRKKQDQAP